jgi:uncharacterized protein (DUF983 family)
VNAPRPGPASRARILAWGLRRRCPRCGAGGLFHHHFELAARCPRCGLVFERGEGYWTGALAINNAIAGAVFVLAFVAFLVATVPDVPVGPGLAILVPLMVVTPIVAYPWSKTIWMAVDRAVLQRLDPRERIRGE